jgi:hypothetical protein
MRASRSLEGAIMSKRFFLDCDNSGHWYVVHADKRSEWVTWCSYDDGDERGWDVPVFARRVNGAVSRVEFEKVEANYVD